MSAKIILYTAHHCPWAQRVQIALRELEVEFETVLVDITIPRTSEYLAINPCGQVPALCYDEVVLTESGLITQFLADSYPNRLLKSTIEEGGARQRFRVGGFVDAYFNNVHPLFEDALLHTGEQEVIAVKAYVDAVVKNIEPLLYDAAPFFDGSDNPTLVEVQTGSFILRLLTLSKYDDILTKAILPLLEQNAPRFWKWSHAVANLKSVLAVWDEEDVVQRTRERYYKRRLIDS